jgi:hypothetical protein
MDHVITDNRALVPTEIMVSAAIMAKTDTEIDTALGREQAAGTIIYTAGYDQIKQKALDGSWAEVLSRTASSLRRGTRMGLSRRRTCILATFRQAFLALLTRAAAQGLLR